MSDREKNEKESPAFKVTDRRKFDSSGNPRQPDADDDGQSSGSGPVKIGRKPQSGPEGQGGASRAGSSPPGAASPGQPQAGPSQSGAEGGAIPFPGGGTKEPQTQAADPGAQPGPGPQGQQEQEQEVDFSAFIMSMATGVLMALGEVPDPMTGRKPQVHLESARHTIDIIAMLREKTQGNLDAEEDRIVRQVLYELRMKYMEVVKKMSQ